MRLHFAEPSYSNAGQRQFNVGINGTQVLTNFDIVPRRAGKDKAVVEAVHGHGRRQRADRGQLQSGGGGLRRWSTASRCSRAARWCRRSTAGSWPGGTITINPGTFTNQGTLAGYREARLPFLHR